MYMYVYVFARNSIQAAMTASCIPVYSVVLFLYNTTSYVVIKMFTHGFATANSCSITISLTMFPPDAVMVPVHRSR